MNPTYQRMARQRERLADQPETPGPDTMAKLERRVDALERKVSGLEHRIADLTAAPIKPTAKRTPKRSGTQSNSTRK